MNAYGRYKEIRNASWQVLLDCKISSLPVDIVKIALKSNINIIKNDDANELNNKELAVTMFLNGNWYIIYDNSMSMNRIRFTIAHELAHIFLGHAFIESHNSKIYFDNDNSIEKHADMFAIRILAPACVLWGLNIYKSKDIAKVCQISQDAAYYRSNRMKELYRRNMFLSHPIERKLYDQFKSFIEEYKKITL